MAQIVTWTDFLCSIYFQLGIIVFLPEGEMSNRLTADCVWMLATGALMFLRSHTFTERSSEPETIWSERLNAAHVTDSVCP